MVNIDAEVKAKIAKVNTAKRSSACVEESKEIDKRKRHIHKHKKDCNTRAMRETIDELSKPIQIRDKAVKEG